MCPGSVPVLHTVHATVPVASALYEPTAHAVHAADVAAAGALPYRPAAQAVQARDVVATATLLYLPTTQVVHAEAPATV